MSTKRCPFCYHEDTEAITVNSCCYQVVCRACGASGPEDEDQDTAIHIWNMVSDASFNSYQDFVDAQ